ncbi:uncharacterized protein [Temnothorax nylanderi]|uniref:uncharacterized protein n=1 Tax=Temnothorax nylanderi TaxID=102681 RepID=UPI003A8C6D2E
MAAQILYINNILEVCSKIPLKTGIYCYCCEKPLNRSELYVEAHLFHTHNIFTEEGNFIWKDETLYGSPWRYFTHAQKYIANCRICRRDVSVFYKSNLENHLNRHIKVMDKIREKINGCSGLSQHFTVDTENFKTNCKHCSWSIVTLDGRMQFEDELKFHQAKCRNINEHSESDGGTGYYNVDATIQQPVTAENYASTSFHNDRHERDSENQEDQQSADIMAQILYIKNIWEVCDKLPPKKGIYCYYCRKPVNGSAVSVEAHLFHVHKIFTTEGNFIWKDERRNCSPWRYFTHKQKYIANCIICGRDICVYYKGHLQNHLNRHIEMIDKIREEINRCSGLSQHFTVDTENFKTNCKHCSWSIDTFDGRMQFEDQLKFHQAKCRNINEHSESDGGRTGHYNVDATIQQPVTAENYASTSFHNDRHERGSENQEDQQRFNHSGQQGSRMPYEIWKPYE